MAFQAWTFETFHILLKGYLEKGVIIVGTTTNSFQATSLSWRNKTTMNATIFKQWMPKGGLKSPLCKIWEWAKSKTIVSFSTEWVASKLDFSISQVVPIRTGVVHINKVCWGIVTMCVWELEVSGTIDSTYECEEERELGWEATCFKMSPRKLEL